MNYPLKFRHVFARDMICFLFGHDWKYSPRRKTKYHEDHPEYTGEAPYIVRKSSGNCMWESVAWWGGKCLRCRVKVRDFDLMHQVWYKRQYLAITNAFVVMDWSFDYELNDCPNKSASPFLLPVIICDGIIQYLVNFDNIPPSWINFWIGIRDWCANKYYVTNT